MKHTLVAKGAAFAPGSTPDAATQVGEGTSGSGVALCACGWTSEVLPSGKQRVNAHRVHKAYPTPSPEPEPTVPYRDFHGNYAIAMIPFTEILAEAYGGIEVESQIFKGKLTRRAYLKGTDANVRAFTKLLDRLSEEVLVGLRDWQKANLEKRRGLTDMQKYLQHRNFITDFAKKSARLIKKGDLS